MTHTQNSITSRLAEVVAARTELRDAVQASDRAGVIWWTKELTLRQAFLTRWRNLDVRATEAGR